MNIAISEQVPSQIQKTLKGLSEDNASQGRLSSKKRQERKSGEPATLGHISNSKKEIPKDQKRDEDREESH